MRPLCIYHGNCADGFGSAWVMRKYFRGEIDFHSGVYGDAPPDVKGRDVYIVDFSYPRKTIVQMAADAESLLVIDHHKTAAADLDGLHSFNTVAEFIAYRGAPGISSLGVIFDITRSGAGLTWDVCFPNLPRPALINHIEDRDLWKFAIPGTREIQATIFSHPYDFEIWDRLFGLDDLQQLVHEGAAIERKHHKDVAELVAVTKRYMKIGGYVVPAANLPYTLTSDAGHLMAADAPFAACYWDTPDGRVFSLRSREDGVDVSEIAKEYGGGGHKHASGFRVSFDRLAEFVP